MKTISGSQAARVVILGGGAHAMVLIDTLERSRVAEGAVILDPKRELWGTKLLDVQVLGGDDLLPELVRGGLTHFVVGVGSVGETSLRRRLHELGEGAGLLSMTLKHPSAELSPYAKIGDGSQLFPACVINAGVLIGVNVCVNTGAIIEHGCHISDHVHVATGAKLAGGVIIGEGAHIGIGATVLQNLSIGARAVVGAGAVVTRDVPRDAVVVGVPARLMGGEGV